MVTSIEAYSKIIKCIHSCNNLKQITSCKRMISTFELNFREERELLTNLNKSYGTQRKIIRQLNNTCTEQKSNKKLQRNSRDTKK